MRAVDDVAFPRFVLVLGGSEEVEPGGEGRRVMSEVPGRELGREGGGQGHISRTSTTTTQHVQSGTVHHRETTTVHQTL